MTDEEIARIARGLTKARRVAVEGAVETVDGRFLVASPYQHKGGPWPVSGFAQYYSLMLNTLTPLGLRVRQYLQEHSNA